MSSSRRPLSLLGRLLIVAGTWCTLAVGVAAIILIELFQDHLVREADAELQDQLVELVSIARLGPDDRLNLAGRLPNARYRRPFSGWGWQIRQGDAIRAQSPSLGPLDSATVLMAPAGEVGLFRDESGRLLRGLSRAVEPRFSTTRLIFVVARPEDEITQAVAQYRQAVLIALGILGVSLVVTAVAALWIGLRPLRALRLQIARMRAGEEPPPQPWPREIAPIAAELDLLKLHTERLVDRAKGRAADLAHAIKTPLSVIRQQAGELPEEDCGALLRQADRIGLSLDRHLGQSGAGGAPYRRVPVAPCVDDLVFALTRAHPERKLEIETYVASNAAFLGDEADLYDILGNPLDNAGSWARGRIRVAAQSASGRLHLAIEDDGAGIPEAERLQILERGRRLDEAKPGHGLGLAILRDLVELYGGYVSLDESALGGLAVRIDLPGS